MHKRTALFSSIVALALFIVGFVLAANNNAGAGLAVYSLGSIATLVAWIAGLIKTAQLGRWGWFVGVLLLSPISALLYGIIGPEEKRA